MAFSFGNPGSGNVSGGPAGGVQLGQALEDIQTTVCNLFKLRL